MNEVIYPALRPTYEYLIQYAKLYNIDLTDANQKEIDGDKYGAQPNDINLDICGSIHKYDSELPNYPLINHVIIDLVDWGYDYNEIAEAFANTNLEADN